MATLKAFRFSGLIGMLLNTALLVCLAGQSLLAGCLLVYGYLPLPTVWANQLIAQQAPEQFNVTVETARLHGLRLTFSNLEVHTTLDREPLLTFKSADINFVWRGLHACPQAETFRASEGTLYRPPTYAPSGRRTALLERLALSLTVTRSGWQIDRFAALHENIQLLGSFSLPPIQSMDTNRATDWLPRFYEKTAIWSAQKEQIENFENPTVLFSADQQSDGKILLAVNAGSQRLNHPEMAAEEIQFRGKFSLMDGSFTALEAPVLIASRLHAPRFQIDVYDVNIQTAPGQLASLLKGVCPRMHLAASRLKTPEYQIEAPILRLDTKTFPDIHFQGGAGGIDDAIRLNGQVNTSDWSGEVGAVGRFNFAAFVPEAMRDRFPEIQFPSRPHFDLRLKFDPGLAVAEATLDAHADNLQVEDMHFDRMHARSRYSSDQYSIDELRLSRRGQSVTLSFDLNSSSRDYRLGLVGTAVPDQYNSLLPGWWAAIFRDFSFNDSSEVFGDFIVRGSTERKAPDGYFGHAEAKNVTYRGVPIDTGELIVQGHRRNALLRNLQIDAGDGWTRGDIAFTSRADGVEGLAAVHCDLEGRLKVDHIEQLVPKNVAPKVGEFETDALPRVQLRGSFLNQAYYGNTRESHFTLEAECSASITYKDILFEGIRFQLHSRSRGIHLRDVEFGYADGQGSANADILTRPKGDSQLVYKLALLNSSRDRAFAGLPQFGNLKQSLEPIKKQRTSAEGETEGQARFDLHLHGQGPSADIQGHSGYGRFEIRDENLTTIQLLGPLSKLLQNTELNFTSFNLNSMRGEFAYENEHVYFDPLRIDGLRTQIRAPGTLNLRDQSINMRVSIFLFGNTGKPDSRLRQIRDLIKKPIPNLLEFDLSGTLQNQQFRSLYDPRNLIPEL